MTTRTQARTEPTAMTGLRRLPPLPGHTISWPTTAMVPALQGTLALDLDEPVLPDPPPHLVAVADRPPFDCGVGADAEQAMRARAARFTLALEEVVDGDRPVSQLERWTTAEVYDCIAERVATAARTAGAQVRARTERPRLVSVHVSHPVDAVAEVSGHVRRGGRSRALAVRLEWHLGLWICAALQLG